MEINGIVNIIDLDLDQARKLQSLLNRHGYDLIIDGIVGQKTINAFNQFKVSKYLGSPNMLGNTTLLKLKEVPKQRLINQAGINLIKEFEGFRSRAYLCPANVWTIGYGSTYYPNKTKVKQGDTINQQQGEQLLRDTCLDFEKAVDRAVKVKLTDNQFSALVSFAFNVGIGAFNKSTLLKVLNEGQYNQVGNQLKRWNRGGGKVLAGLTRRRNAEIKLFYS